MMAAAPVGGNHRIVIKLKVCNTYIGAFQPLSVNNVYQNISSPILKRKRVIFVKYLFIYFIAHPTAQAQKTRW